MSYRYIQRLWLFPFLLFAGNAAAQNSIYTHGVSWKKEAMREVILKMPESKKVRHGRKTIKDTSLAEMMIVAIMDKALPAYSDLDHSLTSQLGITDVKSLMGITADTDRTWDYSGKLVTRVNNPAFDYDSICTYRLLEEWTFDPYNGSTSIIIKGIAPVRNYYRDYYTERDYLGRQAIFWLHYEDVSNIMERYRKKHPGNSLTDALWNDYFSNYAKVKGSVWKNTVARVMNISDTNDSNHYWNANANTNLFTSICSAVALEKIKVYDHAGYILDKNRYYPKPDTQLIIDPTTGREYQKTITHNPFFYYIDNIKIVEEWTFDVIKGNIRIQIKNLVPFDPQIRDEDFIQPEREWGWIYFSDVKDLITNYEQEHPTDNFATRVWNSYFCSAVKPTVLK